ncbi:hypothetical protein [Bergeyella zoohelcum]|uniref:hypothetical protein n=1 Tax=Bergeyella zoohelcum TaxID=1015 RepID=UPI002A908CE6|nr:hypothetical protein [Bergeyella zoohelcum]MDY6026590.1 hypothetical protein [Bergeyella zoohelcum]
MKGKMLSLVCLLTIGFASANTNYVNLKKETISATPSTKIDWSQNEDLQLILEDLPDEQKAIVYNVLNDHINKSDDIGTGRFGCWLLGEAIEFALELIGVDSDTAEAIGDAIQAWCNNGFSM